MLLSYSMSGALQNGIFEFRILSTRDKVAIEDIQGKALELLRITAQIAAAHNQATGGMLVSDLNNGTFSIKGNCEQVSDVVTFAAHRLGFWATRQYNAAGHFYTSFAPGPFPSDDSDLIACFTWGQFIARANPGVSAVDPFFGTRSEIFESVGSANRSNYASGEISVIESVYRNKWRGDIPRDWLALSPAQFLATPIRVGELPIDANPDTGCFETDLHRPLLLVQDFDRLESDLAVSGLPKVRLSRA